METDEKPIKADDELLSTIRKRMDSAISASSESRTSQLDDLRFYAGSPDNNWQWPADVLQTRGSVQGQTIGARPTLTINKLPQHVRQITNDQRQNRPSGKVIPVDDTADVEVAEVFDGIVRHIEYISDADVAYDTACENQVVSGEGYVRLLTEYCEEDSFDQDIKIGRIRNSFRVFMDPNIQDPCGADAEWCFITEEMTHDEYKRQFPKAALISSIIQSGIGDDSVSQWLYDETVNVAEYFYAEYEKKTLNLYPGGITAHSDSKQAKELEQMGIESTRSREVLIRKIKWLKTNGYEVLESGTWDGKWIPVVRLIGNEFEIDGRIYLSGIVRNAKDPQRMYNYWVSQEAEMLALAPKAPFIGYGGQFEGYEDKWKSANTTPWPYLEVNPDVTDGKGGVLPLPQRAMPPMAQTGLIQAKMGASDDIKASTGQYDSSIGATSNERSGKAILAREHQADTGTYHYVDNYARMVRHVTRQIVDLVPKIYDVKRVARIIGEDGETRMAEINPDQKEPMKEVKDENGIVLKKIYNPGVGKYDVRVTTGPSYMTKRQEALEGMVQVLQGNPQLWGVAGDLVVKHMDWPGAQELSKRIAKTIDPKLLGDEKNQSPELQAAEQQMQVMAQELDQLHNMLKQAQNSIEVQEQRRKDQETEIKAYQAETQRIAAVQDSMTPDQIQDIVLGTIHGMITSGDLNTGQPREAERDIE